MAVDDKQHKTLKNLITLCLLANLVTLGVVIYGTFYQDAQQKMAMEKLQGTVMQFQGQAANIVMRNPEIYRPLGGQEPIAGSMYSFYGSAANPHNPADIPKACGAINDIGEIVASSIANAKMGLGCQQ